MYNPDFLLQFFLNESFKTMTHKSIRHRGDGLGCLVLVWSFPIPTSFISFFSGPGIEVKSTNSQRFLIITVVQQYLSCHVCIFA